MYTLSDFISVIQEMIGFFSNITEIEKIKLNAATKNDIILIEDCMKKEQAEVLRFRGLDKKRNEIQDVLGFHNLTLSEILPLVDKEQSDDCALLFSQLGNVVTIYQKTANSAKTVMEVNLHQIDTVLTKANVQSDDPLYSPTGQTNNRPSKGNFTSRQA